MNMENDISLRMSKRLITVAELLRGADVETVADVGCDHGYVSIYLVQKNIAKRSVAMDLREGPLSSARENVISFHMEDKIKLRLSDGLAGLKKDEADGLVIAGMGGRLMIDILNKGRVKELGIKTAVLQPQSDIDVFRDYLDEQGFAVVDERVVFDEGKYYFPMRVRIDGALEGSFEKPDLPDDVIKKFGRLNLLRKDPCLLEYLNHGREVAGSILEKLDPGTHPERYSEVSRQQECICLAINYINND